MEFLIIKITELLRHCLKIGILQRRKKKFDEKTLIFCFRNFNGIFIKDLTSLI